MPQRFRLLIYVFTTGSVLITAAAAPAQDVLYVVEGGIRGCSSWVTACDLQDALGIAQSGDEIWVAAGTYTPTEPGGSHYDSFQLISGVALYGGFIGNETQRNQRDWEANETVLSGDLNGNDGPDFTNYGDNSYHVLTGRGADASAVLDGFTITSGHAYGPYPHQLGGGMFNDGGSPTVTHCTFIGNLTTGGGGAGMYNIGGSSPTVSNCTFRGNHAKQLIGNYIVGGFGGGMCNLASSPTLTNCIFSGNLADYQGGAMVNAGGSPKLTNCTISGNIGEGGIGGGRGGGIYNSVGSIPIISNCILWGNIPDEVYVNAATPMITYSNVQGGWPGEGNINADPLFAGSDLYLLPGSPCIDTADNLSLLPDTSDLDEDGDITEPTPFDLDGTPRLANGTVDMGAYELPVDCNGNGLPDMQDILDGSSADCSGNWVPDECEADCNGNGAADSCDIAEGVSGDCNQNYILDECDLADGTSQDNNGNGVPDECEQPQNVLYVKEGATGVDCSSWADACSDLQDALAIALPGDEVWVAAGRYTPTWFGWNRYATFELISGVALYGGFVGNETERNQRDWKVNETILSGDIYGNDGPDFANNDENSYHVVTTERTDAQAILDGFTITGGNADLDIFMFGETSGAGLLAYHGNAAVRNCLFRGNSALATGGAIYMYRSSSTLSNCTFSGNRANLGGAMYIGFGYPTIINSAFISNSASDNAGAIYLTHGAPAIINCTFFGNSTNGSVGGLRNQNHNFSGNPTVTNCIFWENTGQQILDSPRPATVVSSSCIQGGYPGVGNIDDDPLFIDAENGDVRLSTFSPAIDTGDNSPVIELSDLGGSPRIIDGNGDNIATVDMGAYETSYDPDDCNGNEVPDSDDIANGTSQDCNGNGVPDECDIFMGTSLDCNDNNVPDMCDMANGTSEDCNENAVPDECEFLADSSRDCDLNGVLDECDIAAGTSSDCNGNGVPDHCDMGFSAEQWAGYVIDFRSQYSEPDYSAAQALGEPDVFGYGDSPNAWAPTPFFVRDFITLGFSPVYADGVTIRITFGTNFIILVDLVDLDDVLHNVWDGFYPGESGEFIDFLVTWPLTDYPVKGVKIDIINIRNHEWLQIDAMQLHSTFSGISDDCNENGVPDECDIAEVTSEDCNSNNIPDECELADCDGSPWCDDCNGNGVPDECDIDQGWLGGSQPPFSEDCNKNFIPDECDITNGTSEDCTGNAIPDECEPDCNHNGVTDSCDIADCDGSTWCSDCNDNGIPDGCDIATGLLTNIHSLPPFSEDCNDNGIPDECEDDPCPICDLNGDGIVDRIDLGIMRRCLGYSDSTSEDVCEVADLDGDGQVTWRDWKLFIECYDAYSGGSDPTTPETIGNRLPQI